MRLGGPLPFGLKPVPITLGSGQTYNIPAGNWQVQLPAANIIMEFWDGEMGSWMQAVSPAFPYINADGHNWRLRNNTGTIESVPITNAGSGAVNGIGAAVTGVVAAFSANGAHGRLAQAYAIVGGAIGATATVTTPGSGLVSPPLLLVDPPPYGGRRARMHCTIAAGAVDAVTVDDQGAGYTSVPNVWVIPQNFAYAGALFGDGTAAGLLGQPQQPVSISEYAFLWGNTGLYTVLPVITAGALTGSGTITGWVMRDYGMLYTGTPTVTITGAGAGASTLNAVTAAAVGLAWLDPAAGA